MKKEAKKEKGHLALKFKLADETSRGLYPDLTKDLLHIKAVKEKGHFILPEDKLSNNRTISKLDAFNMLRTLDQDYWELFIVFDMLPDTYAEVLK